VAVRQNPLQHIARALTMYGAGQTVADADTQLADNDKRMREATAKALSNYMDAGQAKESPYLEGMTGGQDQQDIPRQVMQASNPQNQQNAAMELARVTGQDGDVAKSILARALSGKPQTEYDTKPVFSRGQAFVIGKDGTYKLLEGITENPRAGVVIDNGPTKVLADPVTGRPISTFAQNVDPNTQAKIDAEKVVQGQKLAASANDKVAETTDSIRKEFNALPQVKNWSTVQPVLQSAREAAKVNNASADLNIIYAVAKIMDPESVVRESEMSMIVKAGSPSERLQGLFSYVVGGGRLTAEQRSQIMAEVESRAKGQESNYAATRSQYEDIAKQRGLPASQIFTTMPNAAIDRSGSAGTGAGQWKVLGPERGATGGF
jgi:hypothetical protein